MDLNYLFGGQDTFLADMIIVAGIAGAPDEPLQEYTLEITFPICLKLRKMFRKKLKEFEFPTHMIIKITHTNKQ